MTQETEPTDAEGGAEDRWLAWERIVKENAQLIAQVPDAHLIGDARAASRAGQQRFEYDLEMQRRLKVATEKLTAELVVFRESAEMAAERSEAAAHRSEASAANLERLTQWLIGFTVALVVLTVAVLALTAVLAAKG
ncbi:MAG TPA: hypothetical protein VGM53_31900 [Streptosporangiaceae bacterium]